MQFKICAIVAFFLNIFLNYFLFSVLTNLICIISARPEIPAPESLLDNRMTPKDLFRHDTFHWSHDLEYTHLRHTLYQKMNMNPIIANLYKMKFIPLREFNTHIMFFMAIYIYDCYSCRKLHFYNEYRKPKVFKLSTTPRQSHRGIHSLISYY